MRNFFVDIKNVVILLLIILFLIKIPHANLRFVLWILIGISIASLVDLALHYYCYHKIIITKSAIITGFIVAGIIDYNQIWFIIIIFPLLAIVSKYIIKFNNKHFLNPANTALLAATIFNIPLTWTLESNLYLIIIAGIYFVYKLKKWPHVLSFFLIFSLLMLFQNINPLLLISYFFIFVILIEPKTSGQGWVHGLIFGSIAGISAFLIFTFMPKYDFFVIGLFIANLFNPVIDKLLKKLFINY